MAVFSGAALAQPFPAEIRERMNQTGFDVVAGTPEEFGKFMQEEVERWTKVVQRGGIQPD
jgi:tripartite-type tricarboxylate transporter receptor subunit TctC